MGWGCRVLRACDCYQIQLFISIRQYRSLWSIDSPTVLTLSSSSVINQHSSAWQTSQSSSSSLLSLSDLTDLIIINLTHPTLLIINFSCKSHLGDLTNLISHVHLIVTNYSLVPLTISLINLKFVTLAAIFTVSSNNNQRVLEEHFVISESVHIAIVSSKSSWINLWLWHMYKFSSSTSCQAVSFQWVNVRKLWLRNWLACTVAHGFGRPHSTYKNCTLTLWCMKCRWKSKDI